MAYTVRKLAKDQKQDKIKAANQTEIMVQYPDGSNKTTHKVVGTPAKKIHKKSDEPYKDVLAFPKSGEVSLFENINYHVTVSIGLW